MEVWGEGVAERGGEGENEDGAGGGGGWEQK